MKRKLVADSGCNIYAMKETDYTCCPMTILLDGKEYVDSPDRDVESFVSAMEKAEKSSSACPSTGLWLDAFEGADEAYAVTISAHLSGAYNAAISAKHTYIEENEGKKVLVVDSRTAGPHEGMVVEKLASLLSKPLTMEEIAEKMDHYLAHSHILFSLQSFANFAKNGRISPAMAKIAQTLGIKVIAADNRNGEIKIAHTVHGNKKVISTLFKEMKKQGFSGQRVVIGHCLNDEWALRMKDLILSEFPDTLIRIETMSILCDFYAERGGLLVGYEDEGVEAWN